jgi:hypothetical protein
MCGKHSPLSHNAKIIALPCMTWQQLALILRLIFGSVGIMVNGYDVCFHKTHFYTTQNNSMRLRTRVKVLCCMQKRRTSSGDPLWKSCDEVLRMVIATSARSRAPSRPRKSHDHPKLCASWSSCERQYKKHMKCFCCQHHITEQHTCQYVTKRARIVREKYARA